MRKLLKAEIRYFLRHYVHYVLGNHPEAQPGVVKVIWKGWVIGHSSPVATRRKMWQMRCHPKRPESALQP